MSPLRFQMLNVLPEVDPMVLTLISHAEDVLEREALFRFQLSVSEVLTNFAIHAKSSFSDANIDIFLTLSAEDVSVEFFDPAGAEPFDIRSHARSLSDIDPSQQDGRGLGLIMECADDVDYGISNNRHRLKLDFKARQ